MRQTSKMVPALGLSIHAQDACIITAVIFITDAVIIFSIWTESDPAHPEKGAR
jgi:hypothetical protein